MASLQAYSHSLSHQSPPTLILDLLQARLPASITLLRRLETALRDPPHPQHREGSTFLLATFPSDTTGDTNAHGDQFKRLEPFSIALAARTDATDIDVQLFSSIDTLTSPPPSQEDEKICATQVLALLTRFRSLSPLQLGVDENQGAEIGGEEDTRRKSKEYKEDVVLLGCVHTNTVSSLRSSSTSLLPLFTNPSQWPDGRINPFIRDDDFGRGGPFNKWIFDAPPRPFTTPAAQRSTSRKDEQAEEEGDDERLPQGFEWSTVRPGLDRAQVLAWNPYVRTPEILEGLPCAAIRPSSSLEGKPSSTSTSTGANTEKSTSKGGNMAAWAFLSLDDSVRTVHCMDSYRRRGLAGLVVRRLLREQQRREGGQEQRSANTTTNTNTNINTKEEERRRSRRIGHTNILPGNQASEALFQRCVDGDGEGGGAKRVYQVYWMRVDIGMLGLFL